METVITISYLDWTHERTGTCGEIIGQCGRYARRLLSWRLYLDVDVESTLDIVTFLVFTVGHYIAPCGLPIWMPMRGDEYNVGVPIYGPTFL